MSPRSRPGSATRPRPRGGRRAGPPLLAHPILAALIALLALVLGGCAAPFDPTGPCSADGSAAGAYPDLEAVVPKVYAGAAPTEVDSGRACTTKGLGTLATHGIKELRFAGSTWTTGTDSGLSLALFTTADGPVLDPNWMSEFYEAGARQGKNVTSVDSSSYPVSAAITGRRLDVLNGESYQSVVVWEQNGQVAVAVVADFIREIQTKEAHDKIVRAAVDAFVG